MEVWVTNLQNKIAVETGFIRDVVVRALQLQGFRNLPDVSVALVDDAYIRVLNREYRGVDQPTDVLAFPMTPEDGGDRLPSRKERLSSRTVGLSSRRGEEPPLGDIVISLERAHDQARQFKHPLRREVALLAVHGLLHLLGYEDETEAGASAMWSKQKELLELMLGTGARSSR